MPRSRRSQMDAHIEERDGLDGDTAVAEHDGEEQAEMFPELDEAKPEQKELMRLAKRFGKAKADRDALLSTAKEKMDGAREKLIAQMHECNITKFKHKGVKAELFEQAEKVTVEIDGDDASGDDE